MKIKNVHIARVHKTDEGARLLLSVDIPYLCDEGVGASRINGMYRKIADAILECAEARLSELEGAAYKLTHTYEARCDGAAGGYITLSRDITLVRGGVTIVSHKLTECLCLESGLEIKKCKNVKKQRIIP